MAPRDLLPTPWSGTRPRALAVAALAAAVLPFGPGADTDTPAASPAPASAPAAAPEVSAEAFRATLTSYGVQPEGEPTAAQRAALAVVLHVFPERERRDAVRVAWCESRLDPAAVGHNGGGTSDVGLFQFNDGGTLQHYLGSREAALDPERSARAALRYVGERGWRPWTCGELVGAV